MKFDFNGDTVLGFCADHGGGMGWSLEGHEWNNPREITDPTVKTMMAYFYAHSRGIFTDQAKALGVDETWSSDYTWTMNAWVQAVVWRYQENLFSDPVAACAEELMYVYNNLEHTSYDAALAKVDQIIADGGYDYELSMQALVNNALVSADYDTCYALAAYSASMGQRGTTKADLQSKLNAVSYTHLTLPTT